jgi:hypothetical protein
VLKYDWATDTRYVEDLPLDGMDLSTLNSGAHVLRSHGWETGGLDDVLGSTVPGSAKVVGTEARTRIALSRAAADADIVGKIRDGIIRKLSYGYERIGAPVVTIDEQTGSEVRTWAAHRPYELSFVQVPADGGTGTRSREDFPAAQADNRQKEETMTPEEKKALEDAARAEGAKAEAARQTEIRALAAKVSLSDTDIRAMLDDSTLAPAAAGLRMLDLVAERSGRDEIRGQVSVTADVGDKTIRAIDGALDLKAGLRFDLPDESREYRGASLLDLAMSCLALRGVNTRGLTTSEKAAMALHCGARAPAAHTSADFPYLLQNTAQKILRVEPPELAEYSYFRRIATRNDFSDFKTRYYPAIYGLGVLPVVAEGADYEGVTMGEGRESAIAVKRGAEFRLTMEMILNDDLGGFLRIPRKFARAAVLTGSYVFTRLLSVPQTMGDGQALFHATHNNLSTDGGAPTAARIDELDAKLRAQTDGNGEVIGQPARFLFAPVALRRGLEQKYSDRYQIDDPDDVMTTPIADGNRLYLPHLSGTAYYLGNGDTNAAEYGYLQGEGGPVVERYVVEKSDADIFHCRLVFGAVILEYSAFAKNPGV